MPTAPAPRGQRFKDVGAAEDSAVDQRGNTAAVVGRERRAGREELEKLAPAVPNKVREAWERHPFENIKTGLITGTIARPEKPLPEPKARDG